MKHYITDKDLTSDLCDILQGWPLYRQHQYSGAENVNTLPSIIVLFCPQCHNEQRWTRINVKYTTGSVAGFPTKNQQSDRVGFGAAEYMCRNCGSEQIRFYYLWGFNGEKKEGTFFKAGQYPPLEERISCELEQALKGQDLDLYKKALRCRNFSYGIAALAYLRRVVENKMNDMLDLIAEAAKESQFAADQVKELEGIKTGKRFDDKVTYGAAILPRHLRPGGHNPIDALHDIASEGLHSKSDDECIDIFDKTRLVFEYVFRNLQVGKDEAKAFADRLNELASKKGAPAE